MQTHIHSHALSVTNTLCRHYNPLPASWRLFTLNLWTHSSDYLHKYINTYTGFLFSHTNINTKTDKLTNWQIMRQWAPGQTHAKCPTFFEYLHFQPKMFFIMNSKSMLNIVNRICIMEKVCYSGRGLTLFFH